MTYEDLLQLTLQGGRELLATQAARDQAIEKCLLGRERAAIMPSVEELDSLVRHEAHLDRSFVRED